MERRTMIAALAGFAVAEPLRATLPPLRPPARPDGVSLWTNANLARGLAAPMTDFQRESGIHVDVIARGSDLAMAALYTGKADMALIDRPATDSERQAFEWVRQYPLPEIRLGATQLPGSGPPLMIIANPGNPVRALSLKQMCTALTDPRPCFWRDFGAPGRFGNRAVTIVLPEIDSGTGRFIRAVFAEGRSQLAWDRVREFPEDKRRLIALTVQHDPAAIGITSNPSENVKPVLMTSSDTNIDIKSLLDRHSYLYTEERSTFLRPSVQRFCDFIRSDAVRFRNQA